MGRSLSRTAAFVALWRQLRRSHRDGRTLGAKLAALPRMVVASLRRRYDGLGRIVLMAVAFIYILVPVDVVPELLLGPLGLIDDAAMITWLVGAVLAEAERFLEWEQGRAVTIPGQATDDGRALPDRAPSG